MRQHALPPSRFLPSFLGAQKARWVGVFVFLGLALFFILDPRGAFRHFDVADPDDAMRMAQILDFLGGQSWFDVQQHRLIDGASHWARLADLPVAFLAWPFHLFLPWREAIMAASLLAPLFLLGLGLIPLALFMTQPVAGKTEAARLAPLLLLFAPTLLFQFQPSRVDHHAFQLLIAGCNLALLFRILLFPKAKIHAIGAGLLSALGLWIGTESVPFIGLFALTLGLTSALKGGDLTKTSRLFGVSFAAATLLILPMARPPEEWVLREVTWFSGASVIFAALTALPLSLSATTLRRRIVLFLSTSSISTLTFFLMVPDARFGPYANLDPSSTDLILGFVSEAQPLWRKIASQPQILQGLALFVHSALLPLLLILATTYRLAHAMSPRRRRLEATALLYLCASFGLALFWQARVLGFVQLFCLPLALATLRPFKKDKGLLMVVGGALAVMILPALFTQETKTLARFFAPVARPVPVEKRPLWSFLNSRAPARLIAPMDLGPEILFFTPHAVFAAPYNAPHNRDVVEFFRARDEAKALAILQRLQVDALVFPRKIHPLYADLGSRQDLVRAKLKTGPTGKLYLESDPAHLTMTERLSRNQQPVWLKKIEIDGAPDYVFFVFNPPVQE